MPLALPSTPQPVLGTDAVFPHAQETLRLFLYLLLIFFLLIFYKKLLILRKMKVKKVVVTSGSVSMEQLKYIKDYTFTRI